ncbi:aminopeptidase P family protein [Aliihoeflea sp. 40Bstr573]|uniref:aminopeptidase P family protein n=1 Tax=Aliihoeflea sp. 40Bstr573 TaxID=2696467 RepID=UPI0020958880|nr:aminopeptidase P family protein [Aliihoeflea sp. 40Bstr573]MCO6388079.1 M24 family metallopeptidase [Aliihoeflea sp. 40Bstr573]
MFQTFDSHADSSQGTERVPLLRAELARRGIDGFLVPRADEHQGEYVAARSDRLKWLTGFTGSAGAAIVLSDRATIFVDGRYTLQVRDQTDAEIFGYESLIDTPPAKWIEANLKPGTRLGFDPWLHTIAETKALRKACEKAGGELVALDSNPIDAIWTDQPQAPTGAVAIQPVGFAGELAKDKIVRIGKAIREGGATHTVLTDPSSIAWLFNIRGADVEHTPLALAFAIVPAEGRPSLFIEQAKLGIEARAYLTQLAELHAPAALQAALRTLAGDGAKVGLDPQLAAEWLRGAIETAGGATIELPDPARLPRACKNEAELNGSRAAHKRDGVAVVRFLAWLDAQDPGTVDEISVASRLESARVKAGEDVQMPLRDISFDTISGSGPNGAVIHYRVTTKTNRKLGAGELYLVDSGGQYQDGTTDITRTVAIGRPTEAMRRHYTLVLKGLIAISALRFPAGTRGQDVDPFARRALWQAGLDFAHGTGHGVGSFLAVHEGPQRIARTGTQALLPGMILSNEPGYYRPGEYGIRLENLIVVEDAAQVEGGDIPMHGFETLTLAPFDRRLIDVALLEKAEIDWLDAYHARVAAELSDQLEDDVRAWLEASTAPLSK